MKDAIEAWREVIETWWRQPFRTLSTAATVAWGIFMLVLLLGAGQGLENSLRWQYRDDAMNSLWLYPGTTSRPYRGLNKGRPIALENRDYAWLEGFPDVVEATGRNTVRSTPVRYRDRVGQYSMRAAHPEHQATEKSTVVAGRFLNDRDVAERRKVAVIGKPVAEFLFRGADPIGQEVTVLSSALTVVGVFDDEGSARETQMFYVPITTGQVLTGDGEGIGQLMFTVDPDTDLEQSQAIESRIRRALGPRLGFDPDDPRALRVRNNVASFAEVQAVFTQVRAFTWAVGLGTLLAGVVGVSNIMLISVQERTRELGLRKALGATPSSLERMILREALGLTGIAGAAGLLGGVVVVQAAALWLPENDYLRDPGVDLNAVLIATGLVVCAGGIAGWFPARQAANIPAVEALRA